jgi:hypothetical protein
MKMRIQYVGCLVGLMITIASCFKDGEGISNPPSSNSSQTSSELIIGNREFFYGIPWQKDSSGFKMELDTRRLTDTVIKKGVNVSLAINTDWSSFRQLPLTLNDPFSTEVIDLTYLLMPGRLKIFAKTSLDITWASDVIIEYR